MFYDYTFLTIVMCIDMLFQLHLDQEILAVLINSGIMKIEEPAVV